MKGAQKFEIQIFYDKEWLPIFFLGGYSLDFACRFYRELKKKLKGRPEKIKITRVAKMRAKTIKRMRKLFEENAPELANLLREFTVLLQVEQEKWNASPLDD
jgi:hypothetical protein